MIRLLMLLCMVLSARGQALFSPTDTSMFSVLDYGPPRGGLMGEYLFNSDGSDTSEEGIDLTLNNGATVSAGVATFDGINDYARSGSAYPGSIYALSFWFRSDVGWTGEDAYNPFIVARPSTGPFGIRFGSNSIYATDETLAILDNGSPIGMSYITATINSGWNHVLLNWDGSKYQIYLNGTSRTVYAWTDPGGGGHANLLASGSIEFGDRTASSDAFEGDMDNIRIYSRSLSTEEIQIIYDEGHD